MSRRAITMASIILALACSPVRTPGNARSASPPTVIGVLPPHARLVASAALPNRPGTLAVAYTAGTGYVGLVSGVPENPALIWHRALHYPPAVLRAVGSDGVFVGRSGAGLGRAGAVFAFRELRGSVLSALQKHRSGIIAGDDGVTLGGTSFNVRRHDQHHTGSVRYARVSHFALAGALYARRSVTRQPDYLRSQYPAPNGVVHTGRGDTILLRLQIADTEEKRQTGLMNIHQLDSDSGMIFVWDQPVLESFWMENTYIPLTVAFLAADGTIQETQDMQPLTTDLHTPRTAYLYAIEANLGFFAANGIEVGDRVLLNLTSGQ
jgi:uncharacterized membrane protein (UPF0127 family)